MRPRVSLAFLASALSLGLFGSPVWKAPEEVPFGELSVLELTETDPNQPSLPRPGEEKLGPLDLRGVEPTPDGRGWRLTVQPMIPGTALIPPIDLGDGRQSPELRIRVPRSVPFQGLWMGVGGGQDDLIPYVPFPLAWASVLLLPLAALVWAVCRRWMRSAPSRVRRHRRRAFAHHWPPPSAERQVLDEAHLLGRDLLASHFGEEARSWGASDFEIHHLDVWGTWILSLDAARFSLKEPPFPALDDLLKALEERP